MLRFVDMRLVSKTTEQTIPLTMPAGQGGAIFVYPNSAKANFELPISAMEIPNFFLEINNTHFTLTQYSYNQERQHHRFDFTFQDRRMEFKMIVIGEMFLRNKALMCSCHSNNPTWTWENSCKILAKIRSILYKETEIHIQTLALTSNEKNKKAFNANAIPKNLSAEDQFIVGRLSQREKEMICTFLAEGYVVRYEMNDIVFRERETILFTAEMMQHFGEKIAYSSDAPTVFSERKNAVKSPDLDKQSNLPDTFTAFSLKQ